MLRSLYIRDFVIVDELDIDLESGFTVLTGETGAGKSILLDALSLAMGERADPSQIREGKNRAEISAIFSLNDPLKKTISSWLESQEFSAEDDGATIILKRVIDTTGRSKAFINGGTATLSQLKELSSFLVDIHGQHAHQLLLKSGAQRDLLDNQANLDGLVAEVKQLYQAWQTAKKQLELAKNAGENLQKEQERLAWQLEELDALAPQAGEWAEIEQDHARLANAAKLIEGSQNAIQALQDQEGNAEEILSKAFHEIADLAKLDSNLEDAKIAIESAQIQIGEASHSLNRYLQKIDVDPERLATVEERLKALHSAAKKFKVMPNDLPEKWAEIQEQVTAIRNSQDLGALEQNLSKTLAAYSKSAKKLSQERIAAAKILEGHQHVIAHSTSTYPCPVEELNLSMIDVLKKQFNCIVGYSGHESGVSTTVAAVVLGAKYIERHLTLDRAMWGSDHAASLEPQGFTRLVRDIRIFEHAIGDGVKKLYPSEIPYLEKLRRIK